MSFAAFTPAQVLAGETKVITLPVHVERTNNIVAVTVGTTGVLEFRHKVLSGQWDTAEEPNTLNLAEHKSISFDGAALEAIEIKNTGASPVTVMITQYP